MSPGEWYLIGQPDRPVACDILGKVEHPKRVEMVDLMADLLHVQGEFMKAWLKGSGGLKLPKELKDELSAYVAAANDVRERMRALT